MLQHIQLLSLNQVNGFTLGVCLAGHWEFNLLYGYRCLVEQCN